MKKSNGAVQVQILYQPDPERAVRALLLLLERPQVNKVAVDEPEKGMRKGLKKSNGPLGKRTVTCEFGRRDDASFNGATNGTTKATDPTI